jgi:LEA14-like dessication related protein
MDMFTRSWIFVLLFSLLLMGVGCKQPEIPEYRGMQSLGISKLSMNESLVSANLLFYNPNPYPLKLQHADVEVLLEGKPAGHCLLDSAIVMPARDSFYLPVSFKLDLGSIISNAFQLLIKGQVKVNAEGFVKIKKSGFAFKIPVHYQEYHKLDELMQGIN